MSRVLLTLSATLATCACVMAQAPGDRSASPVTALSISTEHETVQSGAPINVKVIVTNLADHEIQVGREVSGMDCQFTILKYNGKPAQDTKFGYLRNGHRPPNAGQLSPQDLEVRGVVVRVKPRGMLSWTVDVGKLYDLSTAGKYTIWVQRYDPESKVLVKSNVITITITP